MSVVMVKKFPFINRNVEYATHESQRIMCIPVILSKKSCYEVGHPSEACQRVRSTRVSEDHNTQKDTLGNKFQSKISAN